MKHQGFNVEYEHEALKTITGNQKLNVIAIRGIKNLAVSGAFGQDSSLCLKLNASMTVNNGTEMIKMDKSVAIVEDYQVRQQMIHQKNW